MARKRPLVTEESLKEAYKAVAPARLDGCRTPEQKAGSLIIRFGSLTGALHRVEMVHNSGYAEYKRFDDDQAVWYLLQEAKYQAANNPD